MKVVGARIPRYDGVAHVTGRTTYVDDVNVPGTLWAKALRSPHHHAGITKLDTTKAESMPASTRSSPGRTCLCSSTGTSRRSASPPTSRCSRRTRCGTWASRSRSVAAETEELASAAVDAIEIGFEERPALFDLRQAFDSEAPKIHHWGNWYPHFEGEMDRRQIRKGDIDWAFENADTIVQGVYRPAAIEHAPIETQVCQVVRSRRQAHDLLLYAGALLLARCRRRAPAAAAEPVQARRRTTGGGFGGKVDTATETMTCLLVLKANRR
jgi:CO/xanthine dehydrogenase Mo-binding subunit